MKLIVAIITLILTIILIENVSALCNKDQVNINIASLEELDQLYGVGPAIAQNIINSRPFSSIDDLIKVKGIGEARLAGIKSQGLACLENEEGSLSEIKNGEKTNPKKINETVGSYNDINNTTLTNVLLQKISLETIKLKYPEDNTKTIKTEENNNSKSLNKNLIYLLITFSIFVLALILIKNRRRKSEF